MGHERYASKQSPTTITVPWFVKEIAFLQGHWDLSEQLLQLVKANMTDFGPQALTEGGMYQGPLPGSLTDACVLRSSYTSPRERRYCEGDPQQRQAQAKIKQLGKCPSSLLMPE